MVFFVVVTYNSKNYITKCLDSIRLFESSSKIIVVDNYSQDNTLDLVRQYKDIIVFENNENLGFGKANNIGIQHAMDSGAEYIYLLNHDAYLVESVIQKIKVCFQEDLNCGIISPIQFGQDESSLELNFSKFLFEDGVLTKMVNDHLLLKESPEIYFARFVQAASWMIKVDVIKRVGLFNPLFFHYGEDNEYLNRLKYHGIKVGVLTNCRVVHLSNPLNLTHIRNYNVYHQNRVFSKWLVSQMDINSQNDKVLLLKSVSPLVKGFLLALCTLRFAQAFGRFSVLLRIFRVMHLILPTRNMYK
jgi:GT2 family glycosyltransferase